MEQILKTRTWALVALAVVAACASKVEAAPLSLKECILRAIDQSPELSSGRHLVEAYKADIERRRGNTLPYFSSQLQSYEVNGSPATVWYPLGLSQPENGTVNNQHPVHWAPAAVETIGVTYPLIYEGSILGLNDPPPVLMARATRDQQSIANLITEQKVILNVVTDYIYATDYRVQAATAETMAELAKQQLEIVRAQVKVGFKLPQQVEIADAQLEAANQASQAARAGRAQFEENLATLMGRKGLDVQLEDAQLPLSPLAPLNSFLDEVMTTHPALRAQRAKVEVARQQLRVDDSNFWPNLTLNTNFGSAQDLDYFNGTRQHPRPTAFLSYLTLDVPIYDFGARRAAINESKENLLSQKDDIKSLELQIRSEITQAYNEIGQYTEAESLVKARLIAEDAAARLAKAQYQVGGANRLTMISGQLAALQDQVAIQATDMAKRLKYAELQDLSAGTWHWAP